MPPQKRVGIGMIGAGFLARTRLRCYAQVSGYHAEVAAVAASSEESARAFADKNGIPAACEDYHALINLPQVDVVDLCVPNHLHREIAVAAARAGKHVICTKPLTAYVGQDLDDLVLAAQTPRAAMLQVALENAEAMIEVAQKHGVQLMYGENWVYAPSISRAEGLIAQSKGAILEMRGGECHKGSHSPFSRLWRHAGGGALIQLGAHPIGAMLYLKAREGVMRNGEPIRAVAVSAEVGDTSTIAPPEFNRVATGWVDVENWAALIITFSDGSHGVVHASETTLGGMES